MSNILFPGDIILSRSNTWLSKSIRHFEAKRSGDGRIKGSRYSHALMALGITWPGEYVIESLVRVTVSPFDKYDDQEIVIWRRKDLDLNQRIQIASKAISVRKDSYGIFKIPLFALDSVFGTYKFSKYLGLSNFKVCSNLIAWTYEKTLGVKQFGKSWRSVTPDVIDDYCMLNPHEYDEIILKSSE